MKKIFMFDECDHDVFEKAAKSIMDGKVVGITTDTIFGLAFDSNNPEACGRIKDIKQRENDIFTYHIGDISQIRQSGIFFEEKKIRFLEKVLPGPVTVILDGKYNGETRSYGIRFPSNRLSMEFFRLFSFPGIVATSCNVTGNPPMSDQQEIIEFLENKVDYIFFESEFSGKKTASTIIRIDGNQEIELVRQGEIQFEYLRDKWLN